MIKKDKIIIDMFDSIAKSHGYKYRKSLFWYSYHNGILRVIGFHKKSFTYEAIYFIQPLFDFRDCFVLEYGDILVHRYHNNKKNLLLFSDYDEDVFINNISNNIKYFEKEIIPTLNEICSFDSILAAIKNQFFFCRSSCKLRLLAYSVLYSQEYAKATELLNQYIQYEKENGYCIENRIKEPSLLLEYLQDCPSKTQDVLQSNILKSAECLKLKLC